MKDPFTYNRYLVHRAHKRHVAAQALAAQLMVGEGVVILGSDAQQTRRTVADARAIIERMAPDLDFELDVVEKDGGRRATVEMVPA